MTHLLDRYNAVTYTIDNDWMYVHGPGFVDECGGETLV
jgi:hypothetical protein